jgi:hypothetical protein
MKRLLDVGKIWAFAGVAGLLLSAAAPAARAAGLPAPAPLKRQREDTRKLSLDVALKESGELHGAVVRADGSGCSQAKVVLERGSKDAQQSSTDAQGQFLFAQVRPGVYRLTISHDGVDTQKILRVWASETAPPAASPTAVVALNEVSRTDRTPEAGTGNPGIVRGQGPGEGGASPLLVGGGIILTSTALAVPGLLQDDDNDDDVFVPNANPIVTTAASP